MTAQWFSDDQKALKVIELLVIAKTANKGQCVPLTLPEIANATGLTLAQARIGWTIARRTLADLVVCEPQDGEWVYYLTDEVRDGARYAVWQGLHLRTRLASVQVTLNQIRTTCGADAVPDAVSADVDAAAASVSAWVDAMSVNGQP
jgi:hypothetical protein